MALDDKPLNCKKKKFNKAVTDKKIRNKKNIIKFKFIDHGKWI